MDTNFDTIAKRIYKRSGPKSKIIKLWRKIWYNNFDCQV